MSNPKPPVDLGLVIAIHAFAQQGDDRRLSAPDRSTPSSVGDSRREELFFITNCRDSTEYDFRALKLAASARLPVRTSTACGANRFKH